MYRPNKPLDTSIDIVTPENVSFSYRLAGPFRRFPAFLIDMVILTITMLLLLAAIMIPFAYIHLPGLGLGIYLTTLFFIPWFYGGVFETLWNGQTPGKRWMKLRVLTTEGQPINGTQAVLRNLLRYVDVLTLGFTALITMACNRRFQRLGDLVCSTMVVFEEEEWHQRKPLKFQDPLVQRVADQIPPSFRPDHSLAKALALYVQRRAALSPERRIEIARHISVPLTHRLRMSPQINPDLLLCAIYQFMQKDI